MGDLDGAADALAKATQNAAPPQPGTALLLLARGDPAAAAPSIAAALAEAGWNNLARARLLPAQVEIALTDNDLATARSAVTELADLAEAFASPAIRAAADATQGAVLLADGDAAGASSAFAAAWISGATPMHPTNAPTPERCLPGRSGNVMRALVAAAASAAWKTVAAA